MKDMVTSPDFRHVPTSVLAILAQRAGKVFASPATWCRYARERCWRRLRQRVHPSKPTEGIRSEKPDQLWHVDTTVLRLVDGRHVYLRAIIDNFSRKVLAWWAGATFDAGANAILLANAAAAKNRPGGDEMPQSVMVDGGIENFNDAMRKLVVGGLLKLIHAQTDVIESNSMIERFWLSAKHVWLFLNNLDSLAAVRKHVEFYVTQHNSVLPHAALGGRTPDEVYYGTATEVPDQLKNARAKARAARIEANRGRSCVARSAAAND
jgi:transposase-like protein